MDPSVVDSAFGALIAPIYPPTPQDLDRFTHIGGLPSLPRGIEWPRAADGQPLHFLAQIDLAIVPASGIVDFRGKPVPEFPREGALYFFADCATFGIWKQPEASHRVLYASDVAGGRPVQRPPDLMPHNAPDAGVLASTHAPYFPRLTPRPMVLLPHAPISLIDMASAPRLSEAPRDRYGLYAPWTGFELNGDWSRMPLLETGFPWRWLLLERLAISVDRVAHEQGWPGDIREAGIAWHRRAATERPLAKVPAAVADEFCNWLRSLAVRDPDVRYHAGRCFGEATRAAWPYIAFSGDLSDIPAQLVQDLHPMDRLPGYGHHKMLGDAISVQDVHLADESNVLLLRLDSDSVLDFCWGDVGILHIAVSRADLAARDFTRTHLNADCG